MAIVSAPSFDEFFRPVRNIAINNAPSILYLAKLRVSFGSYAFSRDKVSARLPVFSLHSAILPFILTMRVIYFVRIVFIEMAAQALYHV